MRGKKCVGNMPDLIGVLLGKVAHGKDFLLAKSGIVIEVDLWVAVFEGGTLAGK